ncbi:MAG: hypothetical protein ACT4PT_00735, partial [Methanobacteriota archaeon]
LSGKAFDFERAGGLVEAWGQERTATAFYYDVHELSAAAGTSAPATEALFASLSDSGYKATRTYLSPTGLRTDAPAAVLVETVRALSSRHRRQGTP